MKFVTVTPSCNIFLRLVCLLLTLILSWREHFFHMEKSVQGYEENIGKHAEAVCPKKQTLKQNRRHWL
jgi:hypothetical protein